MSGGSVSDQPQPARALFDDADPPERGLVLAANQDSTALGEQVFRLAQQTASVPGDESGAVQPPALLVGCCEKDDVPFQWRIAPGEAE